MITVYKIGKSLYKKQNGKVIDKNGGYREYEYILEACNKISTDKNVLVIVNGMLQDDEEKELYNYMKLFDKRIFIMSDIVSLVTNQNVIKECDYLLHQCPTYRFYEFPNVKQHYSYVPELFYRDCSTVVTEQDSKLIFGGGLRDNQDKILSYLGAAPAREVFIKTNTTDNRLSYDDYLVELGKHRYSLIVSRKKYSELGWITPRFMEAISKNCMPIVDAEYDKTNYFNVDKVNSPNDVAKMIRFYESHPNARQQVLSYFRNVFYNRRNAFSMLIESICKETT